MTPAAKHKLTTIGRRAFFTGLVVAAAVVTWNATAGAGRHSPGPDKKPPAAHELSCDLNETAATSGGRAPALNMLGELPEASGLALSRRTPGILWSMDDSDEPAVVALAPDGTQKGTVTITGAQVRDWEDVSVGPCPDGTCLYIADIGDDGVKRDELTVYRVPEPKPGDGATAKADALLFDYPDKAHDAEALFVTPDQTLYIITKGHPTVLYRAPRDARPGAAAKLTRVAELPLDGLLKEADRKRSRVTDAETSPDGKWAAVRTNSELLLVPARELADGKMTNAWHADLRPLDETQGEGVAISNSGDIYLAGEGGGKGLPGTLAHIRCEMPRS